LLSIPFVDLLKVYTLHLQGNSQILPKFKELGAPSIVHMAIDDLHVYEEKKSGVSHLFKFLAQTLRLLTGSKISLIPYFAGNAALIDFSEYFDRTQYYCKAIPLNILFEKNIL
jgi:hypothetical protein